MKNHKKVISVALIGSTITTSIVSNNFSYATEYSKKQKLTQEEIKLILNQSKDNNVNVYKMGGMLERDPLRWFEEMLEDLKENPGLKECVLDKDENYINYDVPKVVELFKKVHNISDNDDVHETKLDEESSSIKPETEKNKFTNKSDSIKSSWWGGIKTTLLTVTAGILLFTSLCCYLK